MNDPQLLEERLAAMNSTAESILMQLEQEFPHGSDCEAKIAGNQVNWSPATVIGYGVESTCFGGEPKHYVVIRIRLKNAKDTGRYNRMAVRGVLPERLRLV